LHMAAWVVSLSGVRAIFLGADTPISEVMYAAERHDASGVVLSVAAGYDGDLAAHLKALAQALPQHIELLVGGTGAGQTKDSENILNSFTALAQWSDALNR
jgi:MerR family transcriptional regulator, light-induced transcriptional regulator